MDLIKQNFSFVGQRIRISVENAQMGAIFVIFFGLYEKRLEDATTEEKERYSLNQYRQRKDQNELSIYEEAKASMYLSRQQNANFLFNR